MATYYVDNELGSNSNVGDAAHPWSTITYAVGRVSAGDTIKVVPNATAYTDYFTVTTDGTSVSPITITSTTTSKPVVDAFGAWQFQADYWIVELMDFYGYNDWMIQIGGMPVTGYGPDNVFANHVTIQDCTFRHSTHQAMLVCHATYLTVQRCLFRDLRARSAGVDLDAIDVWGGGNIVISGCLFEDIGSDGVHIGPKYHQIDSVTVQNCYFRVNRPYGSETWQDYSTNVAENGVDIKGLWSSTGDPDLVGPVTISGCLFAGFQAIVASQDCSDAEGELGCAIVVHMDATPVTISDCVFSGCDVGVTGSNGDSPGSTYDFELDDCVMHTLDNTGVILFDHAASVVMDGNIIIVTEGLEVHSSNLTVTGNIVDADSFTRADQSGYSESFSGNCWLGILPSVAWQSGSDTTALPAEEIRKISIPADGEMEVVTTLRTVASGQIVADAEADFQAGRIGWLDDAGILGLRGLTLGTDEITMAGP